MDDEINCSICLLWEICDNYTKNGPACEEWTDDPRDIGE